MTLTPRPYQLQGAAFLASRKYAYLADGMRLGKTLQVLKAAEMVAAERMLVIGPASARAVWPAQHALFPNPTLHMEFRSYNEWVNKPHDRALVKLWRPQIVVFDEAHYLKNRKAQRTKTALGTATESSPVQTAEHVWALSGTPMPNDPTELYPVFKRFWPERCKQMGVSTFGHWMSMFCTFWEGQWGARISGSKNGHLLQQMMYDEGRFLRRMMSDVAPEVPPLVWGTELVSAEDAHIPPELLLDRATITALIAENEMPDELVYASVRRALGHYKAQVAIEQLTPLLDDHAMEKVVVFAWHRDVLDLLEAGLHRYGTIRVDGSTGPAQRKAAVESFRAENIARVFIGQIEACGTAIDLSESNDVYFVEQAWGPGGNQQAAERVRAVSKLRPCSVTVLQIQDTYDEAHAEILVRKVGMQQAVNLHGV